MDDVFNEDGQTVCPECCAVDTIIENSPEWLMRRFRLRDDCIVYAEDHEHEYMENFKVEFECSVCRALVTDAFRHIL